MAGRKRIPDNVKMLRGTFQKCRAAKAAPMASGGPPEAPAWLSPPQLQLWHESIKDAPRGLLGPLDRALLTMFVVAFDLFRQASVKLEAEGLMIAGRDGAEVPSPYVSIAASQSRILLRLLSELGFTPTARARIVIPESLPSNDPWRVMAQDEERDHPHDAA